MNNHTNSMLTGISQAATRQNATIKSKSIHIKKPSPTSYRQLTISPIHN